MINCWMALFKKSNDFTRVALSMLDFVIQIALLQAPTTKSLKYTKKGMCNLRCKKPQTCLFEEKDRKTSHMVHHLVKLILLLIKNTNQVIIGAQPISTIRKDIKQLLPINKKKAKIWREIMISFRPFDLIALYACTF